MKRTWLFSALGLLLLVILGWFLSSWLIKPTSYDWPMWRYDANRSAASPQELSRMLHLQWVREYPKLQPTWDDPLNQDLMQFDKSYEPVVLGHTLFIGSNANDRLLAINTETGEELWRFYADGPVRLPPVAADGKVYFVSDDGYLYCVDANQGTLIWKFQGGPSDRKILGNERLISTWPARGGPVLQDGVLYFAAGIWPFMGVFIYALDAETGEEIWRNDSSGSQYMKQPHNSPSYAGVAPQGAFVVAGDKLLVPGGRSVPACYDKYTGEFQYYHLSRYNKTGGAFVAALGDRVVNYHRDMVTSLYELSTGDLLIPRFGNIPVMTEDALFSMGPRITAFDLRGMRQDEYETQVTDRKTGEVKTVQAKKWVLDQLWECNVDASGDLIKAGSRLYAGGKNVVSAIDIPSRGHTATVSWTANIDGMVSRIIAADRKLFVVTLEGRIYAFGSEKTQPRVYPYATTKPYLPEKTIVAAEAILKATGIRDGYCLAYDLGTGELVEALARKSNLRVIAVEPDPAKAERLRKRWDTAGLYGKKLSVQLGDPSTFAAPVYLASLTVFESSDVANDPNGDEPLFEKIYRSVRPYGGVIYLPVDPERVAVLARQIREIDLPASQVRESDGFLQIVREGALPGSADWTHQYGNIANTVKSDDQLVKLPLGILWFGGSSNMDVLPRHGHGPPEQVIDGRLFIEGMDSFSARDVYTGRVLWKREELDLGNFGVYYDSTYKNTPLSPAYNQVHIPGANARGTNFVAASDKVYIVRQNSCLVLDPATGATLDEFVLPEEPGSDQPPEWGYIGVYKDYLIAGAGFVNNLDYLEPDPKARRKISAFYNFDITSSKKLVVMDRHTGKILWTYRSNLGFLHNAIAVGNDKIFCIDRMPSPVTDALKKRGEPLPGTPRLMALNLSDGGVIWSTTDNVFGTWLGYSEEYDILLQAGRQSRDMVRGEPRNGMITYRGRDGRFLWLKWSKDLSYGGPCILHGDTIITDRYAYSLLSGQQEMRIDPFTGEETPWFFQRNYGCNYVIASENLLTFSSAAAGFFDLLNDGGTGNFGGFKSSCTSNLIVANGILNAPDYTRTCSCSYQNQTSLGLVYAPDVEVWTDYFGELGKGPIKRLGVNLGAPGDRKADNGTVWLEYPRIGGPSSDIAVQITPEDVTTFSHHSSRIQGDGLKWVAASGIAGVSSITITLVKASTETLPPDSNVANRKEPVDHGAVAEPIEERDYTVRLYFAELDGLKPGERIFDVSIQGQEMLKGLDIVREAGGVRQILVREFSGVKAGHELMVTFSSANIAGNRMPVICGIELIAEE